MSDVYLTLYVFIILNSQNWNDDVSYKSPFETNASYTNRLSDGNLAQ